MTNKQEPYCQPTSEAHEIKKYKIISKKRGLKLSCLKTISFGPRRFLLLSMIMQRKKFRERKRQTLTGKDIRKTGNSEVSAYSERVERGLTSSSSSRNDSLKSLTNDLCELFGG